MLQVTSSGACILGTSSRASPPPVGRELWYARGMLLALATRCPGIWRIAVGLTVFLLVGCSTIDDRELERAPKPGLVGEPELSSPTDHPSEHILTFDSQAPEAEIRSAFEAYCAKLGLHKSETPPVIKEETWFESKTEGMGMAISPSERDKSLLHVSIFRRF